MALFPALNDLLNIRPSFLQGQSDSTFSGLGSYPSGAAIGSGLLGSSLIGGASGLAGGIISGIFGSIQAKKQRDWQEKMMQREMDYNAQQAQISRDWQEEMWNKNNEYNSASAQRARLEEAGLNPNMMMSGGSAGTAQSAGSSPTPSVSAPNGVMYDPAQSVSIAVGSLNQMAQQLYQRSIMSEQLKGMRIDNLTRNMRNNAELGNLLADIGLKGVNRKTVENGLKLFDATFDEQVSQWQLDNQIRSAQLSLLNLDADAKKVLNSYLDAQQQADLALKAAQVATEFARGELTRNQAVTEVQRALLVSAQAEGQRISNKVARDTADSLIAAQNALNYYNAGYYGYMPIGDESTNPSLSNYNYTGLDYRIEAGRYGRIYDMSNAWRRQYNSGLNVGIGPVSVGGSKTDWR